MLSFLSAEYQLIQKVQQRQKEKNLLKNLEKSQKKKFKKWQWWNTILERRHCLFIGVSILQRLGEAKTLQRNHYVKSIQIRSYFWSVFSCIRTKYRKIRTRNKSVFGHFSCSELDQDEVFPCLHNQRNEINFYSLFEEKRQIEQSWTLKPTIALF